MKLSLVVLSEGKARGQAIPITLPQFLIGRDPQCQLRPASPLISKRHCAVLIKNGKAFVRDFGSTNGTFVNEEQVTGERQIQDEDTLKVGPLTFRVALETTPPVNKPTPPPPKPSEPTDDDSVAAMLLSLQDDAAPDGGGLNDADGVPTGSTVHEMISPLNSKSPQGEAKEGDPKPEQPKEGGAKPADKKEKKEIGDTAKAAAAILEKYARRQRT
ncbi:MAG: FHA domain-containing protein [Gemmataceae bacterium]|nr:FHA domain-containing protein [Gemmataceae bacterium]